MDRFVSVILAFGLVAAVITVYVAFGPLQALVLLAVYVALYVLGSRTRRRRRQRRGIFGSTIFGSTDEWDGGDGGNGGDGGDGGD